MFIVMTMFVNVNVAGVMIAIMMVVVVVMIMMAIVVGVNFTAVIRSMVRRTRRMVRRMVRSRTVGRRRRRAIAAVDVIATSVDFSRRSHREGGKDESNENFQVELHISLE